MKKLLRVLITLLGIGIGCGLVALVIYNFRFPGYAYVMRYTTLMPVLVAIYAASGLLFGLIGFLMAPRIIENTGAFLHSFDLRLRSMPALDLVFGVAGLIVGLLVGFLLSLMFSNIRIPVIPTLLSIGGYVLCALYGCKFGLTRRSEIMSGMVHGNGDARPKVLDTSVIIDGRILDIAMTGFVEGTFVIPEFVLRELRHIADHSDAVKRNRGRRGLDILKCLQKEFGSRVCIDSTDFPEVPEVDLKLLRLADKLGGVLVTNDYNLNKVAAVQNTPVLNINELAGAVKPILLPGEELRLTVMREGKEKEQGVGFLADGTMVIVDGGRKHIGEEVDMVVTSALQTAAGRMIFARVR